ncbi:MAG: tyrosine--tRNA ligase [Alphaproteobacteria bacterium]
MKDDFLNFIEKRGLLSQCTDKEGLKRTLEKLTSGYIGFDCTSDSLHVGSLLPLMILRHFQNFGNKPIILLGGGTTLVGDPSGKDETRKILDEKDINLNKKSLKKIFEKFISFDSSKKNCALLVDNYEWLANLNYINFLRDYGSKFSVNKMLSLESTKQRLSREQNLSFLEFNYSILQAYDFLELNKEYNCEVQFGGSDQWGNIISGIDLIKKINKKETYGLTSPLVTTTDGKKMGKTVDGAIWLSEKKLNVGTFWQYWRNTADEDTFKFLNFFTELNFDEIKNLREKSIDINKIKITLANEVTKLCHGEEKSKKAEYEAKKIFINKNLDEKSFENCENKISITNSNTLKVGLKEILVQLKICTSNAEAKRLITQGAVKIGEKITKDKDFFITKDLFTQKIKNMDKFYLIIFVGKKKYGIVELVS